MFEHKNLDGKLNRIIPSSDSFLKGDMLECRDSVDADPETLSRRQYGVIGDVLVERCLPPEGIGDCWSYDASGKPWWGSVKNPPHMGLVADYNTFNGGEHNHPINVEKNVVAYGAAGEEIIFKNYTYTIVRASDSAEISAGTLVALRELYYA